MKHHFCVFVASLLLLALPANAQQLLTQFDLNHYDGWNYTRSGFVLNAANISNINKGVQLFKASNGTDYTLVSPQVDCSGYDTLQIGIDWFTPTCTYNEQYSLTKSSPVVELLDTEGQVLVQHTELLTDVQIEHQLQVKLALPAGSTALSVRLAAWTADYNSPGQVRSVVVYGLKADTSLRGDFNGDGSVDVSDVTAFVAKLLNGTTVLDTDDLNGDGRVDVGDVTTLINLCLTQ